MIMKKKNCLKYCQRKLNSCKLSLKVRIYVVLKDFKSTTLSVKVTNKAVQLSTDLHQIQDFIYLLADLRRDLLFSHQVPQFLQLSVGWVQSHVFLAGHVGCMYKLVGIAPAFIPPNDLFDLSSPIRNAMFLFKMQYWCSTFLLMF